MSAHFCIEHWLKATLTMRETGPNRAKTRKQAKINIKISEILVIKIKAIRTEMGDENICTHVAKTCSANVLGSYPTLLLTTI